MSQEKYDQKLEELLRNILELQYLWKLTKE
jgi:hypothetical protein